MQENGAEYFPSPPACFRELSARQVNAYLKAVPVLDKAGAYAVQEGEWIVEAVHGSLTNVVGLPVERLGQNYARGLTPRPVLRLHPLMRVLVCDVSPRAWPRWKPARNFRSPWWVVSPMNLATPKPSLCGPPPRSRRR